LHGFSGLLGLNWGFWMQNRGRGGVILTPNELVVTFWGSYVCANLGENRSRNATMRVLADGQTHRHTDANGFYNLSHARCYSYGTDNYRGFAFYTVTGHYTEESECLSCTECRLLTTDRCKPYMPYQVAACIRAAVSLLEWWPGPWVDRYGM